MNRQAISKIVGTGLICLIVASVTGIICESRASATGQLVVHFIDVGQGDAILIDYGSYEMLIDGGQWGNCAGYIPSYVDGALEVVVATHPHADHIGGLINVLDAFVVEDIWVNGDTATTQTYTEFMAKVNAEGAQVHQAQRGTQISLSTLTFDVLQPKLPLGSDTNENSIVLELSFGQVDFLFTGDACAGAEASMLSAGIVDDIDILKVGHHGSSYSSTASFLAAAQPEIAIYSAGIGNTYGHPAPETIARLHDIGASIYGTDVYGTIIVTTDGTTYSVHPASDEPPTASFSYLPSNPIVGENVTFDASASNDPDGSIVSYQWNLGDGDNATGVIVHHSYSSSGNYTVSLTVTDDDGAIDSTDQVVHVRLQGDANGDGQVDALDVTKVERIIAGLDTETTGADANQDARINAVDITKVERIIAGLDSS
jgi:beta-lactamase superfamily II metal-dependent hydrolase